MASKRKSESGQVMVLAAGAMILIIGVAALAVDLGFLYATRRNMQTAADAAAIAGSNALERQCGTTADCTCDSVKACSAAGTDVAQLNGISASAPNSPTITVATATTRPANDPNPGNGTFVQATVSETVPTFFMRALGIPTVNITTTAIAGFAPVGPCVTATAPTQAASISLSGSGSINASCGVIDESSNSDGLNLSGGASINAGSVGLVATSWSSGDQGNVTPTPSTGTSIPPNPYANLVPPPPCSANGGCTGATCNNLTVSNPNNGYSVSSTPPGPISPGVYCGGINVSGNGTVLKLNPGVYILTNQHANMVSGGGSMQGTGVTFYNTYTGAVNNYRGITFSGGASTNLAAPTSGAYSGVLFYQDPSIVATGNSANGSSITGGTTSATLTGALYFPTTMLTFSGGASATAPEDVALYAYMIVISGPSFLGSATGGQGQLPAVTVSRLYQ